MRELLDRADTIEEKEKDILLISICAGFTAADIYEIGPSVTVTVDTKQRPGALRDPIARANEIAEEFMDYAFEHKSYSSVCLLDVPEAIRLSKQVLCMVSKSYSSLLICVNRTKMPSRVALPAFSRK